MTRRPREGSNILPEDKAELLLDLLSPETARGCAVIGEVMEREAFAVEVL